MRGYEDDEYDDYDDYEEEGYEQEESGDEYEEEEEERKPTKEEAEYLELRDKLKENFRRKKGASGSQEIKKDSFGSFFGPSKPVIAPRVIQESKSFLENQHLAARVLKPQQNVNKSSSSRPSGSKPGVRPQPPRVSEQKKRVQKIKDTRDYSFLLSEDAELPASPKQPPSRSVPAPSSAKFSSQSSRQTSAASNVRHVNGGRDERRPTSTSLHSNPRSGSANGHSNPRPVSANGHSNPRPVSANGHSNPRPVSTNGHSNPRPVSANGHSNPRPVSANGHSNPRPVSANGHSNPRPVSASHSNPRTGSTNGHSNPRAGSANGHSNPRVGHANGHSNTGAGSSRLSSDSKPQIAPNRKQLGSNSGSGPGRPAMSNGLGQNKPIRPPQKFPSQGLTSGTKSSSTAKMQASSRYQVEPRRDIREPDRGRVPSKHAVASNRPQIQGQMNKPQKQTTSHNRQQDQRPKKRPSRPFPDDDDDDNAILMIRQMFKYNPNKYAGRDEDDSDMEANFDDIEREEKRSARIARQEDEEQLRLIEEEEKRERMRKLKRRKVS